MIPPLTLRLRMILLFCVVIGVFLAGTYAVVYSSLVRSLRQSFDEHLLDLSKSILAGAAAHSSVPQVSELNIPGQLVAVVGEDGSVTEQSQAFRDSHLRVGRITPTVEPSLRSLQSDQGNFRAALIPITNSQEPRWLLVAESTAQDRVTSDFRERAFGLWTVSLLLTTLIAVWYVGRSLRPIVDLNLHAALVIARASRASREDMDLSLPIANPYDELGILARNFNVLFARLSAVVRQLRQFVSDAAHELRTPLSVVRGETQFLLSQRRSPQEYELILRTIDSELTVMVRMIEGLFTLSMADAGQLQLQSELLQLDEVAEEACGIAMPGARRKNIRIEQAPWMQVQFSGDQALLRQVFLILLENAVKYSPSNTTVRIGLAIVDGSPNATVQDEGPGIPPEHLSHIFERFYRAAPQSSDEARSGGLGLAIAQAIMRAHGGEIHCRSDLGGGSVFTLVFPSRREAQTTGSLPATKTDTIAQQSASPVS
jgi:signal transduction histidine kinase